MIMYCFAHVDGHALNKDGSRLVDQEKIEHVFEGGSLQISTFLIQSCSFRLPTLIPVINLIILVRVHSISSIRDKQLHAVSD